MAFIQNFARATTNRERAPTDTGYGRSKMELHGTVTFQLPVGCGGSSLPSQWRNSPKPICGICLSPRLWASLSRSWINMTEVDARASSPLTGERNLDSISSAGARIFSLRIAFFTPAPPTLFRIHDFRFSTRLWISNLRKLELRLKARGRTLIQLNKKKKKKKKKRKRKRKRKSGWWLHTKVRLLRNNYYFSNLSRLLPSGSSNFAKRHEHTCFVGIKISRKRRRIERDLFFFFFSI